MQAYLYSAIFFKQFSGKLSYKNLHGLIHATSEQELKVIVFNQAEFIDIVSAGYYLDCFSSHIFSPSVGYVYEKADAVKIQPATLANGGMEAD